MIRKLASIRKIKEIRPIKDADKIELAIIDGWQVVVQKNQFKVDDLAIYCEIDSFLPEKPEFEFLRKTSFRTMADGSNGFRLRTMKLRGELSQGLLLPLHILNNHGDILQSGSLFSEGDDVTEILGIKKYEAPIPACLAGDVNGIIPGCIQITDQERIQNLMDYFELYKSVEFEETEKLDGASMTVYYSEGDTGVCGRQWDLKETENNTYWKVAKRHELIEKLKRLGLNIAIQCELIGEGIQLNPYKLKGQTFKIYDVWDIDHQHYMTSHERLETLSKLGIDQSFHVPILGYRKTFEMLTSIDDMLKFVTKPSILTNTIREGVVFKSTERINLRVVSFKCISNEYLLGGND